MLERRRNFMVPTAPAEIRLDDDILFSDFMLKWLEVAKSTIQITTYASYQGMVERVIVPYFRKRGIKLVDLKATDLQDFYNKQLERVKANSVIHYHANIHKALKYAVKIDLIPTNPADKVERPKKNEFKGSGGLSLTALRAAFRVRQKSREALPERCEREYALLDCPGRVKAGENLRLRNVPQDRRRRAFEPHGGGGFVLLNAAESEKRCCGIKPAAER